MHEGMSDESAGNEEKVNWKRKVFAAGFDLPGRPGSLTHYRIFLVLIALHTSIFLLPAEPLAGVVLLLALVRGWLNGL